MEADRLYEAGVASYEDPVIWVPGQPSYTLSHRWYPGDWRRSWVTVRPSPSPQPAQWQPSMAKLSAPAANATQAVTPNPRTQSKTTQQQLVTYGNVRAPSSQEGFGVGGVDITPLGMIPQALDVLGLFGG